MKYGKMFTILAYAAIGAACMEHYIVKILHTVIEQVARMIVL